MVTRDIEKLKIKNGYRSERNTREIDLYKIIEELKGAVKNLSKKQIKIKLKTYAFIQC